MAIRPLLQLFGAATLIAALGLGAGPLPAQELGRTVSPIVTLDRDQLYAGTLYGQRIKRELDATSQAMAGETRRIEAALEDEEKSLTEKRSTLPADEFRSLADAFDQKVQNLRSDREKAQARLQAQVDQAQAGFFNTIGPILGQLVRERGAVLIVDRRAILLAAADVDITKAAIERIDAVLGDGSTLDNGVLGTTPPAAESPTDPAVTADPATPDAALPAPAGDGDPVVDTIPAPAEDGTAPAASDPVPDTGQPQ